MPQPSAYLPLTDHPLRHSLSAEVHARPYMQLQPSERISYLALYTGETGARAEAERLGALCQRFSAPSPAEGSNFHLVDCGHFRLRWERHTEFTSYAFVVREPLPRRQDGSVGRFDQPVIARVPRDWLERLEGQLLCGLHLELEHQDEPPFDPDRLSDVLGIDNFAGSEVSGKAAQVFMNFTINDDGFGRVIVRDRTLGPRRAGRLVQRLCEIETYRMMALLALPLARRYGGEVTRLGEQLADITQELADSGGLESERALLDRLSRVSSETEGIAAATRYRFGAARAYYALVERRITELRESRIEGQQTIQEFMDRRLAPAMRTCESAADRLDDLSRRVARAGQLLRTRVDVQLEAQNRDLLRSMNRRAKLQLRLQETVEGLSVAAITYYAVGLVAYAAEALAELGVAVPVKVTPGLAIPIVAAAVWFGVRRLRRMIERQVEA